MGEETKLAAVERKALEPLKGFAVSPRALPWEELPRQPHFRDYWIILRKHRWWILAFLLSVVTVVTIASFKMRPVYEAVARVEINRETPNLLSFGDTASYEFYWDMDYYLETHEKILQSETLARETIKALALQNHPEFAPAAETARPAAASDPDTAYEEKPVILGDFLGRLRVERIRKSRLLEVRFEAHDPGLATQVVNTHLANFIEHNFRTRYQATTQASDWLATQLDELKIRVEKSQEALVAYERENQIWAIDEKQNITTQKLSDLNRELTQAEADRMRKESSYRLARAGNADAIPAVRESEVIRNLLARYADLNDQYTEALAQFGPKYPKVSRLEAQRKELEQLLEREKKNILSGIESEYRAAVEREQLVSQALEKQKGEANELAQKLVQYNILKREAETNKQLYEGLLQRIKEAGVSAGLRSSNIRVVDPALVPSAPARPRRVLNILLGALLGLMGGVGLAFLREYMDTTVKSPADVQALTGLPSLALVAQYARLNEEPRNGRAGKFLTRTSPEVREPRVELIVYERPRSQLSEAFRALRTSLLLSQPEHPPQVVLVSSALPKDGKTVAAVNLAATLAQLGDRTLLLDGDLRKWGIAKALGLNRGKYSGLSSYLTGAFSLEQITFCHPRLANLAVIPSGPIPPNPAELLSSHRLREALSRLRREYKFIVVDSPPLLSVTDPVILSVLADCVLLVVRSGATPKEALSGAKDLLEGVNCRVLGVVLNAIDLSSPDFYYAYKYYPYQYGVGKQKAV